MAHFARLDESNVVIRVHVLNNEVITDSDGNEQEQMGIDFLTELYGGGQFKQTSYNNNFRKNYAGIGYTYDATRDAFISVKPYPSWTLNEDTCQWEPPVDFTDDVNDQDEYFWNEDSQSWDRME